MWGLLSKLTCSLVQLKLRNICFTVKRIFRPSRGLRLWGDKRDPLHVSRVSDCRQTISQRSERPLWNASVGNQDSFRWGPKWKDRVVKWTLRQKLSPDRFVKKLLVLLTIKTRGIGIINHYNVKHVTYMLENHGVCLDKWPVEQRVKSLSGPYHHWYLLPELRHSSYIHLIAACLLSVSHNHLGSSSLLTSHWQNTDYCKLTEFLTDKSRSQL